jgi:hypothetical protein
MPVVPPEGPPFYLIIQIRVTNTGNLTIGNLAAPWVVVFYADTMKPLNTFQLVAVTPGGNAVGPGESVVLEFTNARDDVFSPSIEEGTELCALILFTWGSGQGAIIGAPPSPLQFTY